jgi:hypothetical protein
VFFLCRASEHFTPNLAMRHGILAFTTCKSQKNA